MGNAAQQDYTYQDSHILTHKRSRTRASLPSSSLGKDVPAHREGFSPSSLFVAGDDKRASLPLSFSLSLESSLCARLPFSGNKKHFLKKCFLKVRSLRNSRFLALSPPSKESRVRRGNIILP